MLDHPIILLIVLAAGLLRWLSQRSESGKPDSERPNVPGQPIPRGGETQTEEERIRRFLEALGQPTTSPPPPKVAPKREFQPNKLPPLTSAPPPLPIPVAAVTPPPPFPATRRVFTPAVVQEMGFELRDLGAQATGNLLAAEQRSTKVQEGILSGLTSAQGLRSAIVLREIFGPPRSLQPFDLISRSG